ncbi:MAG: Ig-like domain-containing protein, partial [Anaerolineae bacterium]|nr:Ig-like domain-containing protein [Thermoflexales bacterium]MDW8408980.1 Ig-like domain-containing protein [Anaerolineae bacterium]
RATANPFPLHDLTVLDPDWNNTFTVTLTVNPALGGLHLPLAGGASGNFNVAGGVYTVTGSITGVNATLAGAVFTPTAGLSATVIVSAFVSDAAATDFGLITLHVNATLNVSLTAAPSTLPAGNLSTITATVTDQSGLPAPNGTAVSFTAAPGAVTVGSVGTVGGLATTQLTSTLAGPTLVTATAGGGQASAVVTFTAGPPAQLTISVTPGIILANGISQSVAVASVFDRFGNPVSGVNVQFLAGIGVFSPSSGATNASGVVTVTLTSLTPGSENVSALAGSLIAQTSMTYQQPPTSQLGLVGALTAVTQTLDAVRKGDVITYFVTITNSGSGALNSVLIVAPIPSGTVYISGSASGGNYAGSSMSTMGAFGPAAVQNAVSWSGGLASGVSHTLRYAVQVLILEGQIVSQPRIYADNQDTGINLSSVVPVQARKVFLPAALH